MENKIPRNFSPPQQLSAVTSLSLHPTFNLPSTNLSLATERINQPLGGRGGRRGSARGQTGGGLKINRRDRVHLHTAAVRDECIVYAIPMQRPGCPSERSFTRTLGPRARPKLSGAIAPDRPVSPLFYRFSLPFAFLREPAHAPRYK